MSLVIKNVMLPDCDLANAFCLSTNSNSVCFRSADSFGKNDDVLDLDEGMIAFPGIINSHDHLDFNDFPLLQTRIYDDYIDWAKDIHENDNFKYQIASSKKIPYENKMLTGLIKNLVCGITTVVNHGIKSNTRYEGIEIHDHCRILHSDKYETWLPIKINIPFNTAPVTIHIGEGKTGRVRQEIGRVLKYNLLNKKIIGIHGITMDCGQAKKITALVWCPESNIQLYGRTASVGELGRYTSILFGTDSTLTADWNIWKHIRTARNLAYLGDEELFYTLNSNPARIWGKSSAECLTGMQVPDVVFARRRKKDYWDSFYMTDPEVIMLVFKNGKPVLIDQSIFKILQKKMPEYAKWGMIRVQDSIKYIPSSLLRQFQNGYIFKQMPVEILNTSIN